MYKLRDGNRGLSEVICIVCAGLISLSHILAGLQFSEQRWKSKTRLSQLTSGQPAAPCILKASFLQHLPFIAGRTIWISPPKALQLFKHPAPSLLKMKSDRRNWQFFMVIHSLLFSFACCTHAPIQPHELRGSKQFTWFISTDLWIGCWPLVVEMFLAILAGAT